jgi:hypothetical protein
VKDVSGSLVIGVTRARTLYMQQHFTSFTNKGCSRVGHASCRRGWRFALLWRRAGAPDRWAAASPRRIERDSNRSTEMQPPPAHAWHVEYGESTMSDDAVKMPSELALEDTPAPSSAGDDVQMTLRRGMIDCRVEMSAVTKRNETGTTSTKVNNEPLSSTSGDCHCAWCAGRFRARSSGGSKQRYCSPTCRHALDRAARRLVRAALVRGLLTIEELRRV